MRLLTGQPVAWHRGGPKGAWFPDQRLVSIRLGMTDAQTRTTLAHEAAHAERTDPPCRPDSPEECRANRRTATILIRPAAYEQAERLYGPQPFLIAAELCVTRELVETYQRGHPERSRRRHVA